MMTIQTEITRKANHDASFEAQLMSDPQALFLSEYGVEIPESISLEVLGKAGAMSIQLPSLESTRLSDGDIAGMAALGTTNLAGAIDGQCTTWWTQTTDCG